MGAEMCLLNGLIGLEVVAVKGFNYSKKKYKNIEPVYILFSDKKTYVEFSDQDYYTYHDCSSCARHVDVRQDPEVWENMMADTATYPDATIDHF